MDFFIEENPGDVCGEIDKILSERKMSRRKLALKAGIPPSTLQSALARKNTLSIEMMQKIADALEIPINYFFTFAPPNPDIPLDYPRYIKNCPNSLRRYFRDLGYDIVVRQEIERVEQNTKHFKEVFYIQAVKNHQVTIEKEIIDQEMFKLVNRINAVVSALLENFMNEE